MSQHSVGSWVFVPDLEDAFVAMKVLDSFRSGDSGTLDRDGFKVKLSGKETKDLIRMDEQSLKPIENMVELKELNEASILHNLRLRFKANEIYTNVGSILVSVNPFKLLKLYTAQVLEQYKEQGYRNLPPHVYGVADDAYKQMVANQRDQACIVSGESGAGKTEATKIFLQYIAEVSGQSPEGGAASTNGSSSGNDKASRQSKKSPKGQASMEQATLQEQILKANPLMEAFGNAKTVRNNNSSRFGKWIEVQFNNQRGNVIGGKIVQYLLEKSRVVSQAAGERNYHIFYNLCAGAQMDPAFKEKFRLMDPEEYYYLAGSGVVEVEGISDEQDFEVVLGAMETVGIGISEQDDVIRTICGILHLGNIEFERGGGSFEEGSKVSNRDMLELAAAQFGTSAEQLESALCFQNIRTNRDVMKKALNVEKATDSRDVLAKEVYAKIFEWLIGRINTSLSKSSSESKTAKENRSIIGVLDIFGFESFANNSFEQLCINYCNEKLQFHFNDFIFAVEQKEYRAENIDVSQIDFADNQPTLDLFEAKRVGIFSVMDDEMSVPKSTDMTFLNKIVKAQEKHPSFRGPGVKTNAERESFTVQHYAGEVMYNINGFLEKNRDKMSQDIEELLLSSKVRFVSNLTNADSGGEDDRKGKGGKRALGSIGSKFQGQLAELMKTLNATDPHFVRCVKPNDEKVGGVFSSHMVLDQLRYAGLLEVCRIRQIGYPIRKNFKEFFRRYIALAPSAKDAKALCGELQAKGLMGKGEWQVGKSKVFIRNAPYNDLEAAREVALRGQAILLQKIVRRFLARCTFQRYMRTLAELRQGIKKRSYEPLKAALEAAEDLPNQGSSLPVVQEAWEVLQRLEEERRVQKLLQQALEKRDLNALRSAVNTAEEIKLPSCSELKDAKAMIKKIEEEKACLEEVKAAIEQRSLDALSKALKKAEKLGIKKEEKEIKQATVLLDRLEEEDKVSSALSKAAASGDERKLKDALQLAQDIGLESSLVADCKHKLSQMLDSESQEKFADAEAKAKQQRDRAISEAKEALASAADKEDVDGVAQAKQRILELGVRGTEIDKLLKVANKVEAEQSTVDELVAAINTMRTLAESEKGIALNDVKPLSKAIKAASQKGLTEEVEEFKDAVSLEQRCMEQIVVQKELQTALDQGKLDGLKRALDHAGDLDMNIGLVKQVRQKIKDLEGQRPKSARVPEPRKPVEMNEEEFEKHRNKNMEKAQGERYNVRKYYKIRSDGDYAKGVFFNKKKVVESKLTYQKTPIPRSILELDKDLNKLACAVHKSILGYTGEQLMSFPATLAQDVLIKGLEQPELVDEIYIQICKHLISNPKPESVGRAWQLMCMAVGTFPPSKDFEYYLLNFLLEHVNVGGLVGNYARYSLRRLDGMLIRGASGFVPNIDEILAYKERPPILATIELVDGTPLTEDLPVTPDLSVAKVLEICSHFLSLQDERASMFGIFVVDIEDEDDDFEANPAEYSSYSAMRNRAGADEPPPPPGGPEDEPPPPPAVGGSDGGTAASPARTPRPLRSRDFLGDVVVAMTRQGIKHTFVFKRKIFLPNSNGPSKDPVYMRLTYLQAADEVINGNIPITKETDVVTLTAMAIACDNENFPDTEKELLDQDLISYLPTPWRTKKSEDRWATTVLAMRSKVAKKSLESLQQKYIEMVSALPLYGFSFFYVRKEAMGADIICAVNSEGLTILTLARTPIESFRYSDLHRWGGTSTQFWILIADRKSGKKNKMNLFTSQARDLSNLILDYAMLAADKAKS